MKHIILSSFPKVVFIAFVCTTFNSFSQEKSAIAAGYNSTEAKCTGSTYCRACSNCSRCAHCNGGGSCGVCSGSSNATRHTSSSKSNSKSSSRAVNYASNDFNLKNDSQSENFLRTLNVTIESLNLRNGPGANFSIKAKLQRNQDVFYLARLGDWVKVRIKDSQLEGFVHSKYLVFSDN